MLSKFAFIIVMTKYSLSSVTNYMQKCPRNHAMNKLKSPFYLSFGDLYGRAGDQGCIWESWHIWATISVSKFKGFPEFRLCYKMHSKQFSMYYWFVKALERIAKQSRTWGDWGIISLLMSLACTKGMWNMLVLLTFIRDFQSKNLPDPKPLWPKMNLSV